MPTLDVGPSGYSDGYGHLFSPGGQPIISGATTTTGGVLPMMPGVPNFTAATMPDMGSTAMVVSDAPVQSPNITPEYLNQRLPSIIDNTPTLMTPQCDPMSQWVNDNPLLAFGLLAGAFLLVRGKR